MTQYVMSALIFNVSTIASVSPHSYAIGNTDKVNQEELDKLHTPYLYAGPRISGPGVLKRHRP